MAEKIILKIHPNRVYLAWYYMIAGALLLISFIYYFYPGVFYDYSFYLWFNASYIAIYTGVAGLFILFLTEVDLNTHLYIITNLRILKRKGALTVWEYDILWEELARYFVKYSIFDRMVGNVGSVVVKFVGSDKNYTLFEHVENIGKIKSIMDKHMKRA